MYRLSVLRSASARWIKNIGLILVFGAVCAGLGFARQRYSLIWATIKVFFVAYGSAIVALQWYQPSINYKSFLDPRDRERCEREAAKEAKYQRQAALKASIFVVAVWFLFQLLDRASE